MLVFLVLQLTALAIQLGFLIAQIRYYRTRDYDRSLFCGRVVQICLLPVFLFAALFFATK